MPPGASSATRSATIDDERPQRVDKFPATQSATKASPIRDEKLSNEIIADAPCIGLSVPRQWMARPPWTTAHWHTTTPRADTPQPADPVGLKDSSMTLRLKGRSRRMRMPRAGRAVHQEHCTWCRPVHHLGRCPHRRHTSGSEDVRSGDGAVVCCADGWDASGAACIWGGGERRASHGNRRFRRVPTETSDVDRAAAAIAEPPPPTTEQQLAVEAP